jgi:RNA polymerase sigma factor (TIGR02999 family)
MQRLIVSAALFGHSDRQGSRELARDRSMLQQQLERLIQSAEQGDARSREELFTLLYGELHRLAQRELRRNASLTMSPTTLLHETYLNLSGRESAQFPDRARFLGYAARAMRGLLIDYVRSRRAQKRGGAFEITSLPTELPERHGADAELEGIGEALQALESIEPRLAQLVDLKFFCGFSFGEIGELLGISERTAQRDWDKARILLQRHIRDRDPTASDE